MGIEYEEFDQAKVLKEELRGDFTIGESAFYGSLRTLVCKKCGSDHFTVGVAYCYTAIKCSVCDYQIPIHQG